MNLTIKIVLFAISTLMVNKMSAQSNFYEGSKRIFYGGLVVGGNFATIDNDDFTHYAKTGANLGGLVFARLGEHADIGIEMLFSRKGRKTNDLTQTGVPGVNFTNIYDRLNYVEVPIMINYVDKYRNHFGVGISYSRLVNYTELLDTDPYLYIPANQHPFNKEDYQLLIGSELHVWKEFFLTLRFQFSIVPIRNGVPTNFSPQEQYNNLWVVRCMYLFP